MRVQFKSLFQDGRIAIGKKWVSNNHFIVNRDVLTKPQNNWLDKQNLPDEDKMLENIIDKVCKYNIAEKGEVNCLNSYLTCLFVL